MTRQKARQSATKEADKLCGQIVRARGFCESGRENHSGELQWAHGFSRRYRATRWKIANSFALCRGCHLYFTMRPLEWDEWLRDVWGELQYNFMRSLALSGERPDMKEVLSHLRNEVKAA